MSTAVRRAMRYDVSSVHFSGRVPTLPRPTPLSTAPVRPIVVNAR